VIAITRRMGIPVFTILPGAPDRGTLFDAGPNFFEVGRQGGMMAAEALEGADLTKIPIRDVLDIVPAYLSVNTTALKGLKEPWRVPDTVLKEANVVVDETGVRRKATAGSATSTSAERPLGKLTKKWRLSLVQLNRVLDAEEAEMGVLEGLRESGLVEGRDFEKTVRDAQGDMATVSSQMDAALGDRADLILAFSTPVLQAALQRVKQVPVVFTFVADAIAAGAGTSVTNHVANVTGVYLLGAYEQMPALIRAYLPKVRVVGTVYVPAEVNMVKQLDVMSKVMREAGLELKVVAANSASEVGDAALALVASHVDAFCQLPGNLTAAAFPSIAQVSKRARVPVFVFQGSQVRSGAVAGLARDYYDSGRASGAIAARVMRGESPATIPFVGYGKTKLVVNVAAARDAGLKTPADILAKADEVIGK
jgi:putative tryptophan/tyrosine transport system substrate-binding protein